MRSISRAGVDAAALARASSSSAGHVDEILFGEEREALHHVAQLAHVAGPAPPHEPQHRARR